MCRPAYVGKGGPEFKLSKIVEVRWLRLDLQLCQREMATDKIQEKKFTEGAAI